MMRFDGRLGNMKNIFKGVSALAVCIAVILSFCITADAKKADINGTNWMSAVSSLTPITRLNVPGTHDSGAY